MIKRMVGSGYWGPCDGCGIDIEGRQVEWFEFVVNERGGHRHYCSMDCLNNSEDKS